MKYLQSYNESILKFLKPKSKDKILDAIKKLKPEEKFIKACEHGLMWLVEEMLSDPNFDPSVQNNEGVLQAGIHKHEDIVNLLLKNEKVIRKFYNNKLQPRLPDEAEMEEPDDIDDELAQQLLADERHAEQNQRLERLLRISREELEGMVDEDENLEDEDEGLPDN